MGEEEAGQPLPPLHSPPSPSSLALCLAPSLGQGQSHTSQL